MPPKTVKQLVDDLVAKPALFRSFKAAGRGAAAAQWIRDNGYSSPKGVAAVLATLNHAELKAMKKGRDAATKSGVSTTYKAQMV